MLLTKLNLIHGTSCYL